MEPGTGRTPAAVRRDRERRVIQKILDSVLVVFVPLLIAPTIYYGLNLNPWPWFTLPLVWVVGLTWIWWPRRSQRC